MSPNQTIREQPLELSVRPCKVLLVTGTLAKNIVEMHASESKVATKTFALETSIAAFLTPEMIARSLKDIDLEGFDMILVPGLIRGDTSIITKTLNIPAFKGPRYAADLPTVLDSLEKIKLSAVIPACDLLRKELQQKALHELEKAEQNREVLLTKPGSILIGGLAVGQEFPIRILAEIVDAPLMDDHTIQATAKRFVQNGANIVDVGMIAGESRPSDARRIVELVREAVDVPVSIDTLDPAEIQQAVLAGAALVLSADEGNIETIAPYASKVAVVVIPTNQRQGYFPKKAEDRVKFLEEIIRKAHKLGVKKCVADLILEPSNILESFVAFREFARRNPHVPIFVGVSNVTELMDADSVGVNAVLARLSAEVDASILLATEKSDKAKGTVSEEAAAAKMMFLAKKRGSVPKDLGIDLLMLKDKRNREEPYLRSTEENVPLIVADTKPTIAVLDSKGSFTIRIDRQEKDIVARHHRSGKVEKPDMIIRGKTADTIYAEIMKLGLVSRADHSAYLGSELAKAEIALKTGKEYIQDKAMFTK